MIISKYNIELHRLTEADIELVRHHRNSDAIRSKMFFQDEISLEDQKEWFATINNAMNYYFLVVWQGKKVGLIHGTITSLVKKTTTGGVFFWDDEIMLTYVPVFASIIMGDLTFFLLDMLHSTAIVRFDNQKALQYNTRLGYTEIKREGEKVYLDLIFKNYQNSQIRGLVKRISKDPHDLSWSDVVLIEDELRNEKNLYIPTFLEEYKKAQEVNA